MPYDVNTDDTQEFAIVDGPRRFWRQPRYLAVGAATLGMAALIGVAVAGTGSAARTADPVAPKEIIAVAPSPAAAGPAPITSATPKATPTPSTTPSTTPTPAKTKATSDAAAAAKANAKAKADAKARSAAAAAKAAAHRAAWVAPMRNYRMTSCYGPRWGSTHQGIDFAVAPRAPIYAAAAGTVVLAGWNAGGYGNMVVIKHSAHLYTLYGHASALLVKPGQKVKAGQKIMLEGSTGHVTGPHLHFEVWNAMWHRISPAPFLRAHGVALPRC